MSDALDQIVGRLRRDDPAFGTTYDREYERTTFVLPFLEARRARGWSQRDLARESGVAQPVIARFECGDTDPKLTTLMRLAKALGMRMTFVDESQQPTA